MCVYERERKRVREMKIQYANLLVHGNQRDHHDAFCFASLVCIFPVGVFLS